MILLVRVRMCSDIFMLDPKVCTFVQVEIKGHFSLSIRLSVSEIYTELLMQINTDGPNFRLTVLQAECITVAKAFFRARVKTYLDELTIMQR